jgi:hypothetical protein
MGRVHGPWFGKDGGFGVDKIGIEGSEGSGGLTDSVVELEARGPLDVVKACEVVCLSTACATND